MSPHCATSRGREPNLSERFDYMSVSRKRIPRLQQLALFSDEKTCNRCGKPKHVSHFNKRGDGLRKECKSCFAEWHNPVNRSYKNRNREAIRQYGRAYAKEYRRKNPEKVRSALQDWHEKNAEHERSYRKKRYRSDPGRFRAEGTQRYWSDPEKYRGVARNYHLRHPEKRRERYARWEEKHGADYREALRAKRKTNPESFHAKMHRYRAQLRGNGGEWTAEEWVALKAHYDFTCLCCGRREPEISLTFDHVIPVSRGGPNTIGNAEPLCRSCNSRKGAKIIDFRIGWRGNAS